LKRIIVASTNPVKINAALTGFKHVFAAEHFNAEGISVPSGVSDQPMTSAETLRGAHNRAENARTEIPDADYWIGIEGGVDTHGDQLEAFAWIVVMDKSSVGKARTGSFFLPDETARLIHQGMELGDADDIVFGRSNSKQQNGSVGILTHDVIDRTAFYVHAVILALIPFKNPHLTFTEGITL